MPAHLSRRAFGGTALALLAAQRLARAADAQRDPHRLGHLQPRQHRAEGTGPAGAGIRQRQDRRALGAVTRLQQGAGVPQCGLDRFRLDRRRRGADRQDQRQSDQVGLCVFAPGMDRAGHHEGQPDPGGRRPQGPAHRGDARHRPAHLPGARAGHRRADRARREAGAAAASRWPHRARARRRRRLGRPGPDDGRRRSRERRAAVLPQRRRRTPGAC